MTADRIPEAWRSFLGERLDQNQLDRILEQLETNLSAQQLEQLRQEYIQAEAREQTLRQEIRDLNARKADIQDGYRDYVEDDSDMEALLAQANSLNPQGENFLEQAWSLLDRLTAKDAFNDQSLTSGRLAAQAIFQAAQTAAKAVQSQAAALLDQVFTLESQQQIQALQYFRFADMPVKRVFFPLHKAMDGFMSDEQYERFYWKPLRKIIMALIDMDVTPYIYTEGPYNTRLKFLTDVPKGKVFYHFENVDMAEAKRVLGDTAAICGNLSISRMEFGKKEDIIEETKRLLDVCAPGGGYLFDFNGSLENCKPENLEAMFETLDKYGKY